VNKIGWPLVALAGIALAALYLFARPQPQPPAAAPAPAPAPVASAPAVPPAAVREFEFDVEQGKIRGPPDLTATQGQRVTVRVRSDVADELHVHGYELSAPVPAGESVALTFIAARTGRFQIELHGLHLQLGALEVQPQ